jgi:hypothetical protein
MTQSPAQADQAPQPSPPSPQQGSGVPSTFAQDLLNKLQTEVNQLTQQKSSQEQALMSDLKSKQAQEAKLEAESAESTGQEGDQASPAGESPPEPPASESPPEFQPEEAPELVQEPEPTTEPTASMNKEKLASASASPEHVPIREISKEFEPPPEVEAYMEGKPTPEEFTLPVPVQDDFGQILLEASQVPKPNITLPLTETQMKKSLGERISESARWLAEWCKHNILSHPGRIFFRNLQNESPSQ